MTKETTKTTDIEDVNINADVENRGKTPIASTDEKPELIDITVTDDILKLNPEMESEGIKVGDKIQVDLKETEEYHPTDEELAKINATVKSADADTADSTLSKDVVQVNQIDEQTLGALSKYAKLYPKNKVFHFTSDGQVFLDSSIRDAQKHQKDLGTGDLKSYSVQ